MCNHRKLPHRITLLVVLLAVAGCTVTNSLYVSDPVPLPKGELEMYAGAGSGMRAKIDDVDTLGNIRFNDQLSLAPNVYFGGQYGISRLLDVRFSMHLPYGIGGFGLRVGPQFSFFGPEADFNLAVGVDGGFAIAKDSVEIFNSPTAVDVYVEGALTGEVFVPVSFRMGDRTRIILTPRYSWNRFKVRDNLNDTQTRKFKPHYPILALGLKTNRAYLEASALYFQDRVFPNFGFVYYFQVQRSSQSKQEVPPIY